MLTTEPEHRGDITGVLGARVEKVSCGMVERAWSHAPKNWLISFHKYVFSVSIRKN